MPALSYCDVQFIPVAPTIAVFIIGPVSEWGQIRNRRLSQYQAKVVIKNLQSIKWGLD